MNIPSTFPVIWDYFNYVLYWFKAYICFVNAWLLQHQN